MLISRRRLSGAALAAMIGVLAPTGVYAQDNVVVGPPQLKDFQLPGQRTNAPPRPAGPVDNTPDVVPPAAPAPRQAPPAAAPQPTVTRPTATRPAPNPPASGTTAPAPAERPSAQPAPAPNSARTGTTQPRDSAPIATPSAPQTPVLPRPTPPAADLTPSEPSQQTPTAAAPDATGSGDWNPFWLALPLLLLGLGGFAWWRRRKNAVEREQEQELASELVLEPEAALPSKPRPRVAAAAAPVAKAIQDDQRAWLEVEFKPSRAAATDKEAIVHYELVLRNVGKLPAGNIRIDSKLFNAGAETDIMAFLGGPIHEHSGSPHVLVAPGDELRLGSTIAIPKEDVREIVIDGRSLFVPAIAINVAYGWGSNGAGRTSKSWLVGREAEQPSQKMGAFRLDLGPRIYRSVGQRQTGLAQMV
jgi:LPXTG-motif cell wall-anchored protein